MSTRSVSAHSPDSRQQRHAREGDFRTPKRSRSFPTPPSDKQPASSPRVEHTPDDNRHGVHRSCSTRRTGLNALEYKQLAALFVSPEAIDKQNRRSFVVSLGRILGVDNVRSLLKPCPGLPTTQPGDLQKELARVGGAEMPDSMDASLCEAIHEEFITCCQWLYEAQRGDELALLRGLVVKRGNHLRLDGGVWFPFDWPNFAMLAACRMYQPVWSGEGGWRHDSSDDEEDDLLPQLLRKLGAGSFGEVWEARLPGHGRVALKQGQGLAAEAALLKLLGDIDGVVHHIAEDFSLGRTSWLAMTLVDGVTLEALLYPNGRPIDKAQHMKRITLDQLEIIARGLFQALRHISDVIVHRDVKPENIMIDRAFQPMVIDVGCGEELRRFKETYLSLLVKGDVYHMSDVQRKIINRGWKAIDRADEKAYRDRHDSFATGLTVAEMLHQATNLGKAFNQFWKLVVRHSTLRMTQDDIASFSLALHELCRVLEGADWRKGSSCRLMRGASFKSILRDIPDVQNVESEQLADLCNHQ